MLAAIASLALPSAAMAESLVPPGNSAAAQYTETFPTAGGQQQAGKGGRRGSRSPAKVLGARNATRLDAQGAQGRAAAKVATTTASAALEGVNGNAPGRPHGGRQAQVPTGRAGHAIGGVGGPRSGAGLPNGSSGFDEVIAQATGSSSSGELGLLLPLLIAATVVWALALLWRRTRRTAQ